MRSNAWITLLAYEARIRHAADRRRDEGAAKRRAAVRSRVLAHLRYAIALDIERFLRAAGDQSGSELTRHNGRSAQGFRLSRIGFNQHANPGRRSQGWRADLPLRHR